MTVTTVSTTTFSSAGSTAQSGLMISSADIDVIRSTWEVARKDGDVAPRILFKYALTSIEFFRKRDFDFDFRKGS